MELRRGQALGGSSEIAGLFVSNCIPVKTHICPGLNSQCLLTRIYSPCYGGVPMSAAMISRHSSLWWACFKLDVCRLWSFHRAAECKSLFHFSVCVFFSICNIRTFALYAERCNVMSLLSLRWHFTKKSPLQGHLIVLSYSLSHSSTLVKSTMTETVLSWDHGGARSRGFPRSRIDDIKEWTNSTDYVVAVWHI